MFQLHPYLIFHGRAQEAINFYGKALNLEARLFETYASSGQEHSAEQAEWIMHAELYLNDTCIAMVCDQPQTEETHFIPVQLSLNYTDLAEMTTAFEQLSTGGKVTLPLAEQFWGAHFGMLTDPFGIAWMMNCEAKK